MDLEIADQTSFTLAPGIIFTELEGEAVLLDSHNGQYFGLNITGCDILRLLQKNQSMAEIEQYLMKEYPDNQTEVSSDLRQLLQKLLTQKLIVAQ